MFCSKLLWKQVGPTDDQHSCLACRDSSEAVRAEIGTYTPAMKLTLLTNIGSFTTLMAFMLSYISGEDPLGRCMIASICCMCIHQLKYDYLLSL